MPSLINLTFTQQINASLQVGDEVYHVPTTGLGSFDVGDINSLIHVGRVFEITRNFPFSVGVSCPHINSNGITNTGVTPDVGSYIVFSKNNIVNNSKMLGYYAVMKFINDSKEKCELFSIGSEVIENSK